MSAYLLVILTALPLSGNESESVSTVNAPLHASRLGSNPCNGRDDLPESVASLQKQINCSA